MAASSRDEVREYEPSAIDQLYDTDFVNGRIFPSFERSYDINHPNIECFRSHDLNRCFSIYSNGIIDGSKLVIIYFHGNGSDLGDCHDLLVNFSNWFQTTIIGIEYAGYGMCEGERNPKSIIDACSDTIVYISKKLNIMLSRMVLYGHSIGGAIALQVNKVFQNLFCGIILHNTFTTIKRIVSNHSFLTSLFISDSFLSNIETIKTIGRWQLLCIIHGEKDELIPSECSKELYNECSSGADKKTLHLCPNSSHNAFVAQKLRYVYILPFLRKLESLFFDGKALKKYNVKVDHYRDYSKKNLLKLEDTFSDIIRPKKKQVWVESDGKCKVNMNIYG